MVLETTCYADDLQDETKTCSVIIGDLYLKSNPNSITYYMFCSDSVKEKLRDLTVLKGRLIVDAFGAENVFEYIPQLNRIETADIEKSLWFYENINFVQNQPLK